ncbi:MAG: hypothetical protein ACRDFX_03750 [Chloroflexota bacterium]
MRTDRLAPSDLATPSLDPDTLVLAPTALEYLALRIGAPRAIAVRTGIGLRRWSPSRLQACVVLCGLAGALEAGMPPGTVFVPHSVAFMDSGRFACDSVLSDALLGAAERLGFEPRTGTLLTADTMITSSARSMWAAKGFDAVDMETGLLAGSGSRFATVRIVLDGPDHPISEEWLRPGAALTRFRLWQELLWMAGAAPRYALRAARIVDAASGRGG